MLKQWIRGIAALIMVSSAFVPAVSATTCQGIERVNVHTDYGYSDLVRAGDFVFVSGHVGWNEMPEAIRIAYGQLDKLLKENGLCFSQVVKETVYTTDIQAFVAAKDVRNGFYAGSYPSGTWVQIDRLSNSGFHLEVELIVYAPQAKCDCAACCNGGECKCGACPEGQAAECQPAPKM
jgi:2-iminobutanoate/2-iminopropanoate deaminase